MTQDEKSGKRWQDHASSALTLVIITGVFGSIAYAYLGDASPEARELGQEALLALVVSLALSLPAALYYAFVRWRDTPPPD